MNIYLYGPPASGKSTVGARLAERTGLAFVDLDELIERSAGQSIPQIFEREGEQGFRKREREALRRVAAATNQVVALGGGALLDFRNRKLCEQSGKVFCLRASYPALMRRLSLDRNQRPLLAEDAAVQLERLLSERLPHYLSFESQIEVEARSVEEIVWEIQLKVGMFRVQGMGADYPVRIQSGGRYKLGQILRQQGFEGLAFILSDENVAKHYLRDVEQALHSEGIRSHAMILPAGEQTKNIHTLQEVWTEMIRAGVDRTSWLVALGGGVIGDIGGFAAATYMRGIPWVVLPTTLLAMADASLGGKTGVDLAQGKNLVGAFHAPRLVLADLETLATLPEAEWRAGMAEVVKAGVIGDAYLFEVCESGEDGVRGRMAELLPRAMGVKIKVIEEDPYERGRRAALNFGHTVAHAIETLSGYRILHGFAVAMGMVAEAQLAYRIGLAPMEIKERIEAALRGSGLPTRLPRRFAPQAVLQAMQADKKKQLGELRFALPERIGFVRVGIRLSEEEELLEALRVCQEEGTLG
ncbi:MAG: 3-dehydroquinate synthase [Anaerolineales bacterium]|nr:3-dehydroquinate synthase [Anaerolineales bacterium]MDW8445850.1 3-dehydroquinate synthase [Anaerolineales bacterium]